jgi:Methyltransferase domain
MAAPGKAELFNEYYYRHGCGRPYERTPEWLEFFDRIAERIVREIGPHTALDAGCAMGFLVEGLRARGVEAFGIDISEYALSQVRPDLQPFCQPGSITDPLPRRYDLVMCIEVLEHLPPQDGDQAIANLCQASDDILFSSTPFDFREATHFNVQPPEHWAERFALQGFQRDVDFDATFITHWATRFRRTGQPLHRVIRDYERGYWQLSKNNTDLRELVGEMREQLAGIEQLRILAAESASNAEAARLLAEVQRSRAWRLMQAMWWFRRALARNSRQQTNEEETTAA